MSPESQPFSLTEHTHGTRRQLLSHSVLLAPLLGEGNTFLCCSEAVKIDI